jgi:uncharacterized membrane protein YeaQ/YmgE (transglycosylase-associated protein family)
MMWTLLVFALVGLLVGAGARLFYPQRQPGQILGTLALGLFGALGGGAISWLHWPFEENHFHVGNLILAFLGAMLTIAVSAVLRYARSVTGRASQAPSQ